MEIKEIFPRSYEFSEGCRSIDWGLGFDFSNAGLISAFIKDLKSIQEVNYHVKGIEWTLDFSMTVLSDIVQNKPLFDDRHEIVVLNYIQHVITVLPLTYLAGHKDLQKSYNWIAFSFCDDLSDKQVKDFEIVRIVEYAEHEIIHDLLDYSFTGLWISDFYYICRCLSAIPHIARDIFEWSQFIASKVLELRDLATYSMITTNMTCWAANNADPRIHGLVNVMERKVAHEETPRQLKCDFLICLSTIVGYYSSQNHWQWAQLCLNEYEDLLKGHQKLQLLLDGTNWAEDSALVAKRDDILNEVEIITRENNNYADGNQLNLHKITDRLVELITPFIGSCIDYGEGEFAIDLLQKWYVANPKRLLEWNKFLIIYPNNPDALKYLISGESHIFECERDALFKASMTAANSFLGISCSVGMVPDFDLHIPNVGRFGVPDENESDAFEASLVDFYGLNNLRNVFKEAQLSIDGFISIPGHKFPFQYMANKYLSDVWPYAVSLEKPLEDSVIKKICMWCGAGSYTEMIEVNAVRSVLRSSNIEIDYFSSEDTSLSQFIGIYESSDYDVIWVMSHGEYDHWEPGSVKIEIGAGEYLSLEQVLRLKVPKCNTRRLLFLNVCDGATYSDLGGIPKLGFAPALSNSQQCVISHLWPVNPYAAALFGALYAIAISKGCSFFNAYSDALNNMTSSNDLIFQLLDEFVDDEGELKARILNQSIECAKIAHAGSPAFFQ